MPKAYDVTLEQMLEAREVRAARQKELILQYKLPLISFTLNIPGNRKKTDDNKNVFQEGYSELIKKLLECKTSPVYWETLYPVTGYEAFVVVDSDERELKELGMQIENTHPLGRLLDYDVIGRDGIAVSRESLHYPERKCLLCDETAHACARNRTHPTAELCEKIKWMITPYFHIWAE